VGPFSLWAIMAILLSASGRGRCLSGSQRSRERARKGTSDLMNKGGFKSLPGLPYFQIGSRKVLSAISPRHRGGRAASISRVKIADYASDDQGPAKDSSKIKRG